ncbi:MAG: hypothetical protein ACFFCS_12360 [Candidatus Hodarchaeota archaeon]
MKMNLETNVVRELYARIANDDRMSSAFSKETIQLVKTGKDSLESREMVLGDMVNAFIHGNYDGRLGAWECFQAFIKASEQGLIDGFKRKLVEVLSKGNVVITCHLLDYHKLVNPILGILEMEDWKIIFNSIPDAGKRNMLACLMNVKGLLDKIPDREANDHSMSKHVVEIKMDGELDVVIVDEGTRNIHDHMWWFLTQSDNLDIAGEIKAFVKNLDELASMTKWNEQEPELHFNIDICNWDYSPGLNKKDLDCFFRFIKFLIHVRNVDMLDAMKTFVEKYDVIKELFPLYDRSKEGESKYMIISIDDGTDHEYPLDEKNFNVMKAFWKEFKESPGGDAKKDILDAVDAATRASGWGERKRE